MLNIKSTLSGGGDLAHEICHMTEVGQELLLLELPLPLVLLAAGILNDLPGLTSCPKG